MSQDIYTVEFICSNCGSKFKKNLPKGIVAEGHGGTCPNCGVSEQQAGCFKVIRANEGVFAPTGNQKILLENR